MYRAPPAGAPLLVACIYTRIVGFDRRTGAHVWVSDTGASVTRAIVVGDLVYAGGPDRVTCLEYLTGKPLWSTRSPVQASTFLVDGDELFVASAGEVAAFSTKDGRLLWHDPLKGWGQFSVALATPGNVAQIDNAG